MICLHCGYCCIKYPVAIVKNDIGNLSTTTESNIEMKQGEKKCPHLQGTEPGKLSCAIHHFPWYSETLCASHSQFETKETNCRIGEHLLKNKTMVEHIKTFLKET